MHVELRRHPTIVSLIVWTESKVDSALEDLGASNVDHGEYNNKDQLE